MMTSVSKNLDNHFTIYSSPPPSMSVSQEKTVWTLMKEKEEEIVWKVVWYRSTFQNTQENLGSMQISQEEAEWVRMQEKKEGVLWNRFAFWDRILARRGVLANERTLQQEIGPVSQEEAEWTLIQEQEEGIVWNRYTFRDRILARREHVQRQRVQMLFLNMFTTPFLNKHFISFFHPLDCCHLVRTLGLVNRIFKEKLILEETTQCDWIENNKPLSFLNAYRVRSVFFEGEDREDNVAKLHYKNSITLIRLEKLLDIKMSFSHVHNLILDFPISSSAKGHDCSKVQNYTTLKTLNLIKIRKREFDEMIKPQLPYIEKTLNHLMIWPSNDDASWIESWIEHGKLWKDLPALQTINYKKPYSSEVTLKRPSTLN